VALVGAALLSAFRIKVPTWNKRLFVFMDEGQINEINRLKLKPRKESSKSAHFEFQRQVSCKS
jgi:hypothetical protein